MRLSRCGVIFLTFLLWVTLMALHAQEQSAEARRILFLAEFDNSDFSDEQRIVIQESLLLRLQNEVESVDFILASSLEDEAELSLLQRAVLNGADSVLQVSISGSMAGLTADFIIFDALIRNEVARFTLEGTIDAQYRNLFAGFWYEAMVTLEETFQPLASSASLGVLALPDSRITIPAATREGESLVSPNDSDNQAVFTLDIPASYRVLVEKAGHYTEERELFLSESTIIDVSAEQEILDRWYIQPGLHMFGFVRLGGGLLYREDQLRLGLDLVMYQAGIQPFQEANSNNPDPSLLVSLPLTTFGISASLGIPVIPWNLPIQPYAEAVFALRFLTDTRLIIDPLFPMELRLEPGMQWDIGRHTALYVGLSNTFTFMTKAAFADLIGGAEDQQYAVIAPWLYFSGLVPMIGVRFGL